MSSAGHRRDHGGDGVDAGPRSYRPSLPRPRLAPAEREDASTGHRREDAATAARVSSLGALPTRVLLSPRPDFRLWGPLGRIYLGVM